MPCRARRRVSEELLTCPAAAWAPKQRKPTGKAAPDIILTNNKELVGEGSDQSPGGSHYTVLEFLASMGGRGEGAKIRHTPPDFHKVCFKNSEKGTKTVILKRIEFKRF